MGVVWGEWEWYGVPGSDRKWCRVPGSGRKWCVERVGKYYSVWALPALRKRGQG